MRDYEPIDLTDVCNRQADSVDADLALGAKTMRGLPFLLGSRSADRVVVADAADGRVTVPIGGTARRVIVAHRLLAVAEGSPTGARAAEYVFRFAGGVEERVDVREQFEIGSPRSDRGTYAAIRTEYTSLQPRHERQLRRRGRPPDGGQGRGGAALHAVGLGQPHARTTRSSPWRSSRTRAQ